MYILCHFISNKRYNVFKLIENHRKYDTFYSKSISEEIDFIAQHFYELCERFSSELKSLSIETIEKIISNDNLKLENENQLLKFVNDLYQNESNEYSILYDQVLFTNVENETLSDFIEHFNKDDMSEETWRNIKNRLKQTVTNRQIEDAERYIVKAKAKAQYKYKARGREFQPKGEQDFDGILNFLLSESNGNISEKVEITASSDQQYCQNVTQYDTINCYQSSDTQNSWICFDFKNKRIIPKNYQIKSYNYGPSNHHPRTWIIEGSNDESKWTNLATENNCSYLNGRCLSHIFTFTNPNEQEFRYIRMTQTGTDCAGYNRLTINCFELYGRLI